MSDSYYSWLEEKFGKDKRLTDDYLKSKSITLATKWLNYHNSVYLRQTEKSLLLQLTPDGGEPFVAWVSKSILTIVSDDKGSLFILTPDWFKPRSIK